MIKEVLLDALKDGKISLHTLHSSRLVIKELFTPYLSKRPDDFVHMEDEMIPAKICHQSGLV